MTHWKTLLPATDFLGPQDFPQPREVTISRVASEGIKELGGDKVTKSPCMFVRDKDGNEYPRKYKVPSLVMFGLSQLLGNDVDKWSGQKVTIYATKCAAFGEIEECLRVQFSDDILTAIKKRMKKRKINPKAWEV